MSGIDAAQLEGIYRREAARITAGLAARIDDVGLAADAVQDAFVEAIEHWRDGAPANPGGWLATTARRKAIDRLRRARAGQEKLALLAATHTETANDNDADDEMLGMIFACCHPALPRESQIALTLRAVCGLATAEIAAAFLVSEPTMTQRLLRARKALRAAKADVRIPDPDELAERLAEVLAVVYLVFNEGYLASAGRQPARRDLAAQAISLTRLLHRLMPNEPEVLGLLALLLLHESRAATRFDGWGRLIRLADQDRARWDQALITEATRMLDRALAMRRPGPYQIQAAIAALHAQAPDYDCTDWLQIRLLYDRLHALTPSPVVLLNRAVATRYVLGPEAALAEITPLAADLDGYRLFHALRAGLLTGLGRDGEARQASERALALAANPAERELLARRLSFLHRHRGPDLDRDPAPVHPGPGLRDLHRLLEGVGVEDRIPAERLLGLHERPVGDPAGPHGPGRGRRLELVPGLGQLARAAAALLVPGPDLGVPGLLLGLGQAVGRVGVHDQDDVFHCSPPFGTGATMTPFIQIHERDHPGPDIAADPIEIISPSPPTGRPASTPGSGWPRSAAGYRPGRRPRAPTARRPGRSWPPGRAAPGAVPRSWSRP
jgi:RNA polymerase sigma-70 factor (ECF subfamily)